MTSPRTMAPDHLARVLVPLLTGESIKRVEAAKLKMAGVLAQLANCLEKLCQAQEALHEDPFRDDPGPQLLDPDGLDRFKPGEGGASIGGSWIQTSCEAWLRYEARAAGFDIVEIIDRLLDCQAQRKIERDLRESAERDLERLNAKDFNRIVAAGVLNGWLEVDDAS